MIWFIFFMIMILIIITTWSIHNRTNYNYEQYGDYKLLKQSANICEKPFRATCDKDKIFSRIQYLEEKLDELEFDMYRKRRKKARRVARQMKDAVVKQHEKRKEQIIKEIKKQKAGEGARQRQKERAHKIKLKEAQNARLRRYPLHKRPKWKNLSQDDKDDHYDDHPPKQLVFTGVDDSGELNKASKKMTKDIDDPEDIADAQSAIENEEDLDMPKGFVI